MTTVGHPPRLLHGRAATVRRVNKADGMSDSPPIASGLPHCRFGRMEHNSQWYAVYLHRGCVSTLNLFMRRSAVETIDPRRKGNKRFGHGG